MANEATPQVDQFEDELFAPIDMRTGPDHLANQLGTMADEEGFEIEGAELLQPEGTAPIEEPEPVHANQPEVFTYGDGSTLTIEAVPTGFKATLNSGKGNPEVFHGTTRDEMWMKIAEAKVHATKKIRELNQELKLGNGKIESQPVATPVQASTRELTAEDMVEIQTQLASNPALAFETWFQKRTGRTVDQLVKLAEDGQAARQELETVAVAEQFVADNPDYFVSPNNYRAILAYVYRNKLKKQLTNLDSIDSVTDALYRAGEYTVENFTEAFDELKESGLLEFKPEAPEVPVAEVPVKPVTPAAPPVRDERIVRTVRRSRAGLGIRPATTVAAPPSQPPSADDLESLTDDQVTELFSGARRERMKVRR